MIIYFDTFNSKTLYCKLKPHKAAITSESIHLEFLSSCLDLFSKLKFVNSKGTIPYVEGWKLSISALMALWNECHCNWNISFLLTNRINQDCLENLFAIIRQSGICRDNPTPDQFSSALSHAMVNVLLHPPPNFNCAYDGDAVVMSLKNFAAEKKVEYSLAAIHEPPFAISASSAVLEINSSLVPSLPEQNTLHYIAGCVAHKIYKSGHLCINSDVCSVQSLFDIDRSTVSNTRYLLHYKALASSDDEFGHLSLPSDELFNFLSKCEEAFLLNFESIANMPMVCCKLNNKMTLIETQLPVCSDMLAEILNLYNTICIYAAVKFANKRLSSPGSKQSRKILKLLHL